ncbi:MAG TPA: methionyl-tRNA formyltransferase, partial [Candidatus Saccharimonadales bacterium]
MSQRILFFGNERLGTGLATEVPVLQALIAANYDVAAVVVAQNDVGQSRKGRALEIAAVAAQHNIPLIVPAKLSEARDQLAAYGAEAAVLVAYGKIVPQSIIDLFPRGIINIHPSLLPKHRGSIPIEGVILSGELETGVSLMRLSAKMDAGPVYAQQMVALQGNETKQQLADALIVLGKDMLLASLPAILAGTLEPTEQDETFATYDNRIQKTDGELDFTKPAVQLEREVRAYAGWPRSRTTIGTTDVIITTAHVDPEQDGAPGALWIEGKQIGLYGSEGLLILDTLIPAGKK